MALRGTDQGWPAASQTEASTSITERLFVELRGIQVGGDDLRAAGR